ncbi:acyl CoA:acetate/3-ketoacid CoA transferase [Brachyspira intermedia]|uniref:acyl CoA:acetate/3-ketoacid CoA transferase n=1 Tax=Brachyspira intermedia TaxID=84377 RepID=UPI003006A131
MDKGKFIKANQVSELIDSSSFIGLDGFVGIGVPEEILIQIEKSFLEKGYPNNLSIIFGAGTGDGKVKGSGRLGHKGLLKRVVAGHLGLAPRLGELANNNEIEAYNLPQGVIVQMFREMAAGKPGILSHVGLGTFVDPELQGGKLNSITTEDIVERCKFKGQDLLFYHAPKLDYAILRGTYADEDGNISYEEEALTLEGLSIATAAKNSGGKVFVQVKAKVKRGSIPPKEVKIPGILVDYVVVAENPENHMQTFGEYYNVGYVKNNFVVEGSLKEVKLDERKIIARRCAMLLDRSKKILNYGIGMPEVISMVVNEEGQEEYFTPTVEPGAIGGTPMGGGSFGATFNATAIVDQPYQFDFYDGGGLDMAFLGLAQCDQYGNINVSKFGPKIAGCGGFINITQNAKEVVFLGTFTTGGLKIGVENGELRILQEGKVKKFIKDVEQVTFSGNIANKNNKKVIYVTERAVFTLVKEGLKLVEIAPGVDLQKDILDQMEFKPIVADDLKKMDSKIFIDKKMGLVF